MASSNVTSAALIGIDTNVVVRLLMRDNETQFQRARKLVASATPQVPLLVNPLVVMETIWVMENGYRLAPETARKPVAELLQSAQVRAVEKLSVSTIWDCLSSNRRGFSDLLIAAANLENGCEFTFTFDRQAARNVPGMKLLT